MHGKNHIKSLFVLFNLPHAVKYFMKRPVEYIILTCCGGVAILKGV